MKTIAFSRRGGMLRTLFVVAALGGLYYFRRQGGSVTSLLSKGTQSLSSARDWVGGTTSASMNKDSKMRTGISSSASV